MVISGPLSYHWPPLPPTGASQTTPVWRFITKIQHRPSAMGPDLPTAMPGWVPNQRNAAVKMIVSLTAAAAGRIASNSSHSHILFAVKERNVPLPLLNLLRGGLILFSKGPAVDPRLYALLQLAYGTIELHSQDCFPRSVFLNIGSNLFLLFAFRRVVSCWCNKSKARKSFFSTNAPP